MTTSLQISNILTATDNHPFCTNFRPNFPETYEMFFYYKHHASTTFVMAVINTPIIQHFNVIISICPIQNIWAWFCIVSITGDWHKQSA